MNGTTIKSWVRELDHKAWLQLGNLCSLPFVFHHVTIMPDAHGGVGMPIGGILSTTNVVIPNAVGAEREMFFARGYQDAAGFPAVGNARVPALLDRDAVLCGFRFGQPPCDDADLVKIKVTLSPIAVIKG